MPSILVVDDDHALRGVLASWVHAFGYQVREAESASEALDALADTTLTSPSATSTCPGWTGCGWRR